jgi:hypothetical protein
MENEISGKIVENAFANNKHGVEITLYRHTILLNYEEVKQLCVILKNVLHELVFNTELNK